MSSAGGVFRLVCGQIGAGKSYLLVKLVEEEAKKSDKYHHIYSNIRGHSKLAEGIEDIPDDWRDCETDSLLIIDEVQMHEKFSKHFSNRRDSEIAQLTMIRHKRIDIWLISPSPTLVNKDVRDLVTQYYYLEPTGKFTTKCFCFTKVQINVTKSIKTSAYDEFVYKIEEKYWKLYESTEDGKASGRNFNLNIKLIGFIVGMSVVVLIIIGMIYFLMNSTKKNSDKINTQETKNSQQEQKKEPMNTQILPKLSDEDCRKGVNVDKPECVAYFNNLTATGASVGVEYDPTKPFESAEKIQENVKYEVTAKPVLSGCMTDRSGKLRGYSQQGTFIDVSEDDCKRIMSGDRPFNYFAQQQASQSYQQQAPVQQSADIKIGEKS